MSDDAERERAKYEALSALVENYRRERDDAREQLYLTKRELGRWVDRETKAVRERDEARAEAALALAERDGALCRQEDLEADVRYYEDRWESIIGGAYRRGAEAMREACARWIAHKGGNERIAWQVERLPIPEEK